MNALTLRHISLAEIIRRCQEEARQTRDKEQGHCFELFQRALGDRQPGAWEAVQQQYQRRVLGWLYKAGVNSTPGVYTWDVTSVVQSWVNDNPNQGLALISASEGTYGWRGFASREASSPAKNPASS